MKERPILFSAPMVRAILDGTKTQERRVVKPQPPVDCSSLTVGAYHPTVIDRHGDEQPGAESFGAWTADGERAVRCPFGKPGDRIWVPEAWGWSMRGGIMEVYHDGVNRATYGDHPWKPAITMPRWASRITLEITSVRVERLQDIRRGDAMEEGCPFPNMAEGDDPRQWFGDLWDSINGEGSWASNPWVWAITFKRVE